MERRANVHPVHASTRRKAIFTFLLLCAILPQEARAQAKRREEKTCVATRDDTILKTRENELRVTADKLLQAFRAGDTNAFLGLVHPKYFSMGESKNYTLVELRKSFQAKHQIYCFLFDPACIGPVTPRDTPETSFSEAAKRTEAKVQSVKIWADEHIKEPGCRGSVTFKWVDPVDPAQVSTFTFLYINQQWKTVGFDFPPTAMPERGAR